MISKIILIQILLIKLIIVFKCELNQGYFKILQKKNFQGISENDQIINRYQKLNCAIRCIEKNDCFVMKINDKECIHSPFKTDGLWAPEMDKTVLEKIPKGN